jgi:nitric oxide reductase NorQ protein
MLVVSFNPGYQRSLRELKPSTRQRFLALHFDYPSTEQEVEIVVRESGVDRGQARKLVQIAQKIRNLTELSLMESVSTRLLVSSGKLLAGGVPPRLACYSAIAEPLTDDPEARTALRHLIELGI